MDNKWLVITMHDERNEFNLEVSVYVGKIESLKDDLRWWYYDISKPVINDEIYMYKKSDRKDYGDNDDFELVSFEVLYFIPFEKLQDVDFNFRDYVVERNMKFGFLDKK